MTIEEFRKEGRLDRCHGCGTATLLRAAPMGSYCFICYHVPNDPRAIAMLLVDTLKPPRKPRAPRQPKQMTRRK